MIPRANLIKRAIHDRALESLYKKPLWEKKNEKIRLIGAHCNRQSNDHQYAVFFAKNVLS